MPPVTARTVEEARSHRVRSRLGAEVRDPLVDAPHWMIARTEEHARAFFDGRTRREHVVNEDEVAIFHGRIVAHVEGSTQVFHSLVAIEFRLRGRVADSFEAARCCFPRENHQAARVTLTTTTRAAYFESAFTGRR